MSGNGKNKVQILAKEGCSACDKLTSFLDDEEVQKELGKMGVDDIEIINTDSEKGKELLNDEVHPRLGKPITITPTTLVKKCDDSACKVTGMNIGFNEKFGDKIADAIGVEKKPVDRFRDIKNGVDGIIEMLKQI